MITLTVEKRDTKTKPANLRKEGFIPAVLYGRKQLATSISVKSVDFIKAWKEAGESSVLQLSGEGLDHQVLIQDIDLDPVTESVRHADFYVLEKDKKVMVAVPLEFEGVASAVKDLGGVLVKVLHELEIEAMPSDLPHALKVDVSSLTDFDSRILAKDVKLPKGVDLYTDSEEVVALVNEAVEEVEEVAPVDLSAIEVEKKGKEVKEGEASDVATDSKTKEVKPKESAAK